MLVYRFTTVADALEFDGWAAMSLAVVDYLLPDGTGTDVLRHLEKIGFKGEKMLCTGYPIQGLQQDALRLSDAVVSKDSLWLQVLWTRWTDHG